MNISNLIGKGVAISAIVSNSFLQVYSQGWNGQKVVPINNAGVGNKIINTSDNGYIVVGGTFSIGQGSDDIYMLKIDSSAKSLWLKTFGGAGGEKANSIVQTYDGGYAIAGWTSSFGSGSIDALLLKTDESGNLLWAKSYGGINNDGAHSIQQTIDRGYIIAGYTYSFGSGFSDVYLLKTDSVGNLEWSKTFGGWENDIAYSVLPTLDTGYVLVGVTPSFGDVNGDIYVIKTDSIGDTLWTKTYGGLDWDEGKVIRSAAGGGYVIAGFTYSFGANDNDAYLLRIDESGNLLWANKYGRLFHDDGWDMRETKNGGYVIVGTTENTGGETDLYLVLVDSNGVLLGSNSFGGSNSDVGYSVAHNSSGGYLISGESLSFDSTGWLIYLANLPFAV